VVKSNDIYERIERMVNDLYSYFTMDTSFTVSNF
jgi:hypothetical protein